ncbi:MAG: sel1 repeat family protein [Thermoguttaceae bacterium]|nr:sel1 repeat family protein [Thermoguttaceae bacterium]
MHAFKVDDTVTFDFKGKERHGEILKVGKKNASVWIQELYDERTIPLDRLTIVAPIVLSEAQVRQFCRYEVKRSELIGGRPEYTPLTLEKPYVITFDDILAAVRNIQASGDDNTTVQKQWFNSLYNFMFEDDERVVPEKTPRHIETLEPLPGRDAYIRRLFSIELRALLSDHAAPIGETISQIGRYVEHIIAEEKKPVVEREYRDDEKEEYLRRFGNNDRLKKATELELTVYRKFIEDLIPRDDPIALSCKGYGCYGGDPAYECDWKTALECVTRLFELTGDPTYANTLGYIYYYGRCWNGEPQYEEAFKFFSIGAAGFVYESRYKLADMFANGYGVPQNTKVAYSIVAELYDQNLSYILDGRFDCKFADIALRLGSYNESGYGGYVDPYDAYKYYLQASFAIRQRLQFEQYGDQSVADGIRRRLDDLLESGKIRKPGKTTKAALHSLLACHLKKYRKLRLVIKRMANGDVKLAIRVAPFKHEKYPPKLFITEPDAGFCGMLETLNVRVKNGIVVGTEDVDAPKYFDGVAPYHDPASKTDGVAFRLGDKTQAIVTGEMLFTPPDRISKKKRRFASVYFSPGGKRYDYLLDLDGVAVGDVVYVMTDRGETEVTVANIAEKTESELALPIVRYKKILRRGSR